MDNIDKRNRLAENVFDYRITKENYVFISWEGKWIKTLKGQEAEKTVNKIHAAATDLEVQLILAKATGNFKRGNEKSPTSKK
ncbi:hypothetical protein [Falsibacillus pallidus]|uniref:Uncharacterized protein n=1 Tax=Falsibacillus pallidus TaxID=493781 RepID=A0A370GP49_9BACI|nr:hypothetical protein [Falsibacillus pallidus]RDI45447.1 hypothetical protein DFR59_10274 [Falsibacillus pallidus]